MDRVAATQLYEQASRLFEERGYAQAMGILDTLDYEFPGEKHILLSKARCMGKLGHTARAMEICNELITLHDYQKARQLMAELSAPPAPEETSTAFSLAAVRTEWMHGTPAEPVETPPAWPMGAACFLVLAAISALAGIVFAAGGSPLRCEQGGVFLGCAAILVLIGIPRAYHLPFYCQGAAFLLWATLPTLILFNLLQDQPSPGLEGGLATVLATAATVVGISLAIGAAASLTLHLAAAVADDMGTLFWGVALLTCGGFFVSVLLAKINESVALRLGPFVTGAT